MLLFASIIYFIVDRAGYILLYLSYRWYALVIALGYCVYLLLAKLVKKVRSS